MLNERPRCNIVYNNSYFSFDLRSSVKDSDYTCINFGELIQNPTINLIENDECIDFNEKAIRQFISYLETSDIPQINNDNLFTFNELSKKFQTKIFQTYIDKYIDDNKDNLLPIIFKKAQLTSADEIMVSYHLISYIDNKQLLTLPINVIDHILYYYRQKNQNQNQKDPQTKIENEKKIMNFVINCLKKHSTIASILFKYIDFQTVKDEFLLLIENHHDLINYQYLPNDLMNMFISENIKTINFLKAENEKLKYFEPYNGIYTVIHYEKGKELDGIMRYLTKVVGGNIHDKNIIGVTTENKFRSPLNGHDAKNLVNFNDNSYFHSLAKKGVNVCFDFKDKTIQLSAYQIKNNLTYQLKNWKIEASNDKIKWVTVDEHIDDPRIIDGNNIVTYVKLSKKSDSFYRFIQLTQTGKNWQDNYYLVFHNIEFYGVLKGMLD